MLCWKCFFFFYLSPRGGKWPKCPSITDTPQQFDCLEKALIHRSKPFIEVEENLRDELQNDFKCFIKNLLTDDTTAPLKNIFLDELDKINKIITQLNWTLVVHIAISTLNLAISNRNRNYHYNTVGVTVLRFIALKNPLYNLLTIFLRIWIPITCIYCIFPKRL